MRVAYVLAEYPVASQTFVHAEIRALEAMGIEVGVVTHKCGDPAVHFAGGSIGAPVKPVHVGVDASAIAVLARYDHVHVHFADFAVRVAGPLADRAHRPWSLTAHAYDIFRKDAAVRPEEWRTTTAKHIVTISRFHRDFIAARGVDPARIAVVPNAASLAPLLRAAPLAPTKLRRVVAVGRPVAKKGFAMLIQGWAHAHLPGVELEIIGGEGLVENPPPGLYLTPMVPYLDALAAMARADLVAAPSIVAADGDMDGIPTVLAEAGALRRPVMASRLAGIPDLVADGVNGLLLPPGDVPAVAMALTRLFNRPSEVERMGMAGPALAAAHDAACVAERLHDEVFAA